MEVVGCKSGVRTGSSHMATLNQSSLNILHTLVVYRGQLSIHVKCRIITNFEDPMSNKNIPWKIPWVEWESLFSFTNFIYLYFLCEKKINFWKFSIFLQIIQLVGLKLPRYWGQLLLGFFLGFGTSGVWLACFVENKRRGKKKKPKDEEKIWDIPST